MAYRWKPNKTQKKAFALRMQDPDEQAAYTQRKEKRAEKKRAGSKFDYTTAGGEYVPTHSQYVFTMNYTGYLTEDQRNAFGMVQFGYSCREKVHHDFIHIVNDLMRASDI